jgi:hypothetical protein
MTPEATDLSHPPGRMSCQLSSVATQVSNQMSMIRRNDSHPVNWFG